MIKRVGFTPPKDELCDVQRKLLDGCAISITCFALSKDTNPSMLPQIKEIKVNVDGIFVSPEEYAIRGLLSVGGEKIGKGELVVDLTTKPPLAYVKTTEDEVK